MPLTRLLLTLCAPLILAGMLALALVRQVNPPPGTQLAYVSGRGPTWDIHLLDVDRGLNYNVTRPFMPATTRNLLPQWSPDGQHLLFVSDFARNMDLLLLDPAESTLRRLTTRGVNDTYPAWVPVGPPLIAYMTGSMGRNWDIDLLDPDLGDVQLVADRGINRAISGPGDDRLPQWSPDGTQLAFISDRDGKDDVYLLDMQTRRVRRLTENMRVLSVPVWSPDGAYIAFVTDRDGHREIYRVTVADGTLVNLTRMPGDDYQPAWSPDGTRIAFVSRRDGDDELFLMDPGGTDLVQLTHNNVADYDPAWSPDGARLAFIHEAHFLGEVYVIDARGTHMRRLTDNITADWSPVWRP